MKRTVLITGCSSGFGKATVKFFLEKGWQVVATMRRPEDEEELIDSENLQILYLDVQDKKSIDNAIERAIDRFERIDVVINNAGFGLFGIFETTPSNKILEQFQVNVFGVMDVTRAVLPHMRSNGGGVIINISSGAGVFTLPMISLYCASKFALEGFSESLSYELDSQNITIKIVEPGGVISTNFGNRSGIEAKDNSPNKSYEKFINNSLKVFDSLRGQRLATERQVAEVIFNAATDGTKQLRYIATEDIKPLLQARRESSENEYIDLMRSKFLM